jgi:D-glycerate 3-kinase
MGSRCLTGSLEAVERALDGWRGSQPFVLGLCGAQGSGKSTLSDGLARRLNARGVRAAVLSLDDLYLSHARRKELARDIHPLFAVRGVPGTHDVARGAELLDAVKAGRGVTLPRFDKATDDPTPEAEWTVVDEAPQVLIFEGWCVGARPQPNDALDAPVNALERERDADGVWRRHVDAALAGPYADLFARLDRLVLLAAPGFEVVERWRLQQEQALRARSPDGARVMCDAEVKTFIQHYERLTRHILSDMPSHADLTLRLDEERRLKDLS